MPEFDVETIIATAFIIGFVGLLFKLAFKGIKNEYVQKMIDDPEEVDLAIIKERLKSIQKSCDRIEAKI